MLFGVAWEERSFEMSGFAYACLSLWHWLIFRPVPLLGTLRSLRRSFGASPELALKSGAGFRAFSSIIRLVIACMFFDSVLLKGCVPRSIGSTAMDLGITAFTAATTGQIIVWNPFIDGAS